MKLKLFSLILAGVSALAQANPQIQFTQDLSAPPALTGSIVAGQSVTLVYNNYRFYDIVGRALMNQSYGAPDEGYAMRFHCYGYGCCKMAYPNVNLRYRFHSGDSFTTAELDGNPVTLSVPATAEELEVYFDIDSYLLKTWYCGSPEPTGSGNAISFTAYDSNYARNFIFPVEH